MPIIQIDVTEEELNSVLLALDAHSNQLAATGRVCITDRIRDELHNQFYRAWHCPLHGHCEDYTESDYGYVTCMYTRPAGNPCGRRMELIPRSK